MEAWSYPPAYDEHYLPPADSRYWFARRETMPPGERECAIPERLKLICRYAYEHAPFYRRKWGEAGFHPDQLRSLEDFEYKVPVIRKSDLREAQAAHPPFGDYLCVPESEVSHARGTSSSSGEGFDELLAAIEAHRAASRDGALGRARRQKIAEFRLHKTAQTLLLESFERTAGALQPAFAQRLARREGDPYSLARELVANSIRKDYPHESA